MEVWLGYQMTTNAALTIAQAAAELLPLLTFGQLMATELVRLFVIEQNKGDK